MADFFFFRNFAWQYCMYSQSFCQKSKKSAEKKAPKDIFFSYFVFIEMSDLRFEMWPHF